MGEDWRSIPGNEHAFGRLRDALASGEAIGFVGAGASAGLYPLWTGLIGQLAQEAFDQGAASDDDRAFWLDPTTKPQQAVRGIKQALGAGTYAEFLRDRFAPRKGADGNCFTSIHRRLAELPFRGLVTTNYDSGLLEALKQVRPASVAAGAGFATWRDGDAVNRWLTSKVFAAGTCPILYAHGFYDRSDTIVLCADEYRDAYRADHPFAQLTRVLWSQYQLVFVGFGFSDPWLDFMAETAIGPAGARTTAAPRHFAVTGLSRPYTPQLRATFRDAYNAVPVFYPVQAAGDGTEDHSALVALLEELTRPGKDPSVAGTADDGGGSGRSSRSKGTGSSSLRHHQDLAIELLEQAEGYLRAIEDSLEDQFDRRLSGAADVVAFFSRCDAADVQSLFFAVRIALQCKKVSVLQAAERQHADKAAVALYCLGACRLVDEAAVRAGLAGPSSSLDYLVKINSDDLLICAIIATAVFGGKLHLLSSETTPVPRPEYGFHVQLPAGGDLRESDFERAVYLSLFANDREATELSLDSGTLDDPQRARLEARLRTLQRVQKVNLVFVVSPGVAPATCAGFANGNRVPVVVPDTAATVALLGMTVNTLKAEIREFWRELGKFRDSR